MDMNYLRNNICVLKEMIGGLDETEKIIEGLLKKVDTDKLLGYHHSAECVQLVAMHVSLRGYTDSLISMIELLDLSSAIIMKIFDIKAKTLFPSSELPLLEEVKSSYGLSTNK